MVSEGSQDMQEYETGYRDRNVSRIEGKTTDLLDVVDGKRFAKEG